MIKRIVDGNTPTGQQYPIQPGHINTKDHFWGAFDHSETEISARYIVRVCQANGGWFPFTKAELDFISRENYWFNRLREHNDEVHSFIQLRDGKYYVTHEFITSCFRSSPNLCIAGK